MSSPPSPRYPSISAAILAGGRATRLEGRPKALLDVEGEKIIDRQLAFLRPRFAGILVAVAARGEPGSEEEPFRERGLQVVRDPVKDAGPMAGLQAALEACRTPWLLAVACDMPHLDPRMVDGMAALAERDQDSEALVPRHSGRAEPLHALYRAELHEVAARCLEERRLAMMCLLDRCRARFLGEEELPGMEASRSWTNLNTPEDLASSSAGRSDLAGD